MTDIEKQHMSKACSVMGLEMNIPPTFITVTYPCISSADGSSALFINSVLIKTSQYLPFVHIFPSVLWEKNEMYPLALLKLAWAAHTWRFC